LVENKVEERYSNLRERPRKSQVKPRVGGRNFWKRKAGEEELWPKGYNVKFFWGEKEVCMGKLWGGSKVEVTISGGVQL